MTTCEQDIEQICVIVRERLPSLTPRLGVILGSGLGDVASLVSNAITIPYADLPGFPRSTVPGHGGNLVLGHIGSVPVAVMQGRFHLYEGHAPQVFLTPIRALKRLGCEYLLITNASGGLCAEIPPASLMLITDHINCQPSNPLVGESGAGWGPRFPDMSRA